MRQLARSPLIDFTALGVVGKLAAHSAVEC